MNFASLSTTGIRHFDAANAFRTQLASRIRVSLGSFTVSESGVVKNSKGKTLKSYAAIEILAHMIEEGGQEAALIRWMAEHARCALCGKALTATDSIERGMGPVCWSRFQAWVEANRPAVETVETVEVVQDAPSREALQVERDEVYDTLVYGFPGDLTLDGDTYDAWARPLQDRLMSLDIELASGLVAA